MTKEVAEKIARGIADKIECNTADIDDWAEFWGFTREEYEGFLDVAVKAFEQHPNPRCDSCIHSEEQDGSNCYECVKGMADNFEAQPTDVDCISREEALKLMCEKCPVYDCITGCQSYRSIEKMSSVTPSYNSVKTELNRVLDRIITQIEQTREKDKLCEYPYNRCIRIIEEHRTGNLPASVPAPKRKAAIERQVIVTWFTPEEKLPEEDIGVLATVTARVKNREFIRAILTVFYCKSEGWYELDYGFTEMTVHAWCDLDPYEGG